VLSLPVSHARSALLAPLVDTTVDDDVLPDYHHVHVPTPSSSSSSSSVLCAWIVYSMCGGFESLRWQFSLALTAALFPSLLPTKEPGKVDPEL
jgi:hypothetical protein